eukprot:TRINITY_DN8310_c0_g1_i1.p1 TRINITY_DN8310_c0_g1~~TRINITY_DN8310_c0_g1_i1.p1  ORF type:complete len:123 (-),score=38.78 TRINITY_DN8310_c0_g1_i1:58-426(-)
MSFIKRIIPLFDRVLVQKAKPQKAVGGIILPESAQTKTNEARVIAVGKGIRTHDGKFVPPCVEAGDIVMLAEYRGEEIKMNGEEFLLIREEDILAKVEQTEQIRTQTKGASDIPNLKDLPKV